MAACEHKFVFLRNNSFYKAARYANVFVSTDIFFCEKCLEYKETEKKAEVNRGDMPPDWALNITERIDL